jgi:predicted nuclease of restriction endonuclease-like (RecB) superfamily
MAAQEINTLVATPGYRNSRHRVRVVSDPKSMLPEPQGYASLLGELKSRISSARLSAALAVNKQLILLYWSIGREILVRQTQEGWGARVIDRLADDLRRDFPEMSGLSARNLKYMRAFAEAYTNPEIVQQVVAQLPWGHNVRLLESVKDPLARLWYARQAIEHGWSRNVLVHQIDSALFSRQGKALTNFARTLPAPQSELAQQIIKDPYSFEFLGLDGEILERDLERSLLDRLSALILELGKGFSFVGSQFPLEVGGQDYRLDLLFYHLKLRCFVVFELKVEEFQPEFAGKMNFYLSAVDDALRHPDDQPSIGIILCKGRNEIVVEYALRDTSKPMGVAQYTLSHALPPQLQRELPSAAQFAGEYTAMSLVKLRIEIERALRTMVIAHDLPIDSPINIGLLLEDLKKRALAPASTDRFIVALRVMNRAAHGVDVDEAAVVDAVKIGNKFLAEISAAAS